MTRVAAARRHERPADNSRLVTEGISKIFGSVSAVDNVSLNIPAGQFVGIIGRSGAGKSTLLRMLNRLTDPTSGRIMWEGIEVTALKGRALREWRRRCAMIFQQFNLVGRLDVLTNVLMGRLAHTPAWRSLPKLWGEEDKTMAMAALDQFGLAGFAAERVRVHRQRRGALHRGEEVGRAPGYFPTR